MCNFHFLFQAFPCLIFVLIFILKQLNSLQIAHKTIVLFLLSGQIDLGRIIFKQAAIKKTNTTTGFAPNGLCGGGVCADVEHRGHTGSKTSSPCFIEGRNHAEVFPVSSFKNAVIESFFGTRACFAGAGAPLSRASKQPPNGACYFMVA